jgi:tripartite-type tricarboxylate transporter receptor subunit TctC
MEKRIGQPVLIESRPGANGIVAAAAVKAAEPDGHSLVFWTAPLIHPLFNKTGGLELGKDLAPVSLAFKIPTVWYVRANLPVQSFKELIAYAKANPGKLNFGSPGALNEVVMQYLKRRAGLDYVSIPYKGQQQTSPALLSGEIDITSGGTGPIVPLVKSGKVRPIFATLESTAIPGVPTLTSLGFPMEGAITSFGFMAPPETPRALLVRIAAEAAAVLKDPAVAAQVREKYDAEPVGSTPAEHMRSYETDLKFWTEAVRLANFKPE